MAKIEWVEQRLERWAEWTVRGGGDSGGVLPMFTGGGGTRVLAGLTLDETECWKTARDVAALPVPLPETVTQYYTSGSMAAQDRLSISRDVLAKRLARAHKHLADAWQTVGATEDQLPRGF
ncbi:MAG: hypothetical protein EOP38_15470 [Rubrivivax sp.]|nr:MAG: hypothetical protein EOP38_15470 [Rubrivivax sp.]